MKRIISATLACIVMLVLIVDANTAQNSAKEGLNLCIQSVIPSLFPFLLTMSILNNCITDMTFPVLKPICKICRIPFECGSYLLLGLLGGYPVGAKCINDAHINKVLTKIEARRLLAFCSNAGPSFIFGILGCLYASKAPVFVLWGIHILSALIVGMLLPSTEHRDYHSTYQIQKKADNIISSIKTMSIICAWVLIFRMIIDYIQNTFLSELPVTIQIIISGALELTNGCMQLSGISNFGQRFVLSSVFLSFGGICVIMQTFSVTRNIGCSSYMIGKIMQTLISFLLASCCQFFIFDKYQCANVPISLTISALLILILIIFILYQKNCGIFEKNDVYCM